MEARHTCARLQMATSLRKRIVKSVQRALRARDRAEMRAMDTLLEIAEKKTRRRKARRTRARAT